MEEVFVGVLIHLHNYFKLDYNIFNQPTIYIVVGE